MTDGARELLSACEAVMAAPGVEIVRQTDIAGGWEALDNEVAEEVAEMFEGITGQPCPNLLRPFLCLPDLIDLAWRSNEATGEMRLAHPLIAWGSRLDPAYAPTVLKASDVERFRILDRVTDIASTSFVLFDYQNADEQGLILFDTRDYAPLPLSGDEYLHLAAAAMGFDSWQYLFAELPITPDRRERIDRSLGEVRRLFPDRDLSEFEARAKAR